MSGFQTAARPRPVFSTNRPPMPVVPFARVGRQPPEPKKGPPTVEDLLDRFQLVHSSEPPARLTLRIIAEYVAAAFGVTVIDLYSERRQKQITTPRQVMFWMARRLTGRSLPEIGRYYGGRDHTTVLHGIRRTEIMMEINPDLREAVVAIQKRLEML